MVFHSPTALSLPDDLCRVDDISHSPAAPSRYNDRDAAVPDGHEDCSEAVTPAVPAPRLSIRDLASMGYAVGHTHWAYMCRPRCRTGVAHRFDDVLTPGYFNDACETLAAGDMIDVVAHDGGGILYVTQARIRPDLVRVKVMCRTEAE